MQEERLKLYREIASKIDSKIEVIHNPIEEEKEEINLDFEGPP